MEFKPDNQLTGYVARQVKRSKVIFWISNLTYVGLIASVATTEGLHRGTIVVLYIIFCLMLAYFQVTNIGRKINAIINMVEVSDKLIFTTFGYHFLWLNLKPLVYKCDRADLYWRHSELSLRASRLPQNQTIKIQNTAGPNLNLVYHHYHDDLLEELHIAEKGFDTVEI